MTHEKLIAEVARLRAILVDMTAEHDKAIAEGVILALADKTPSQRVFDLLRNDAHRDEEVIKSLTAELTSVKAALVDMTARASTLADAAFHFQTCRTCAEDGEDSCADGRKFAAFQRGEEV